MALLRSSLISGLKKAVATNTPAMSRPFCSKDGKHETFAHPIEHATGEEKVMLILEQRGITDPYYLNPIKRGVGTKAEPNLVPSFEEKRMVGCICEEDATCMNWMWVHKNDPKRCECGHWFKCVDAVNHFEKVEAEIEKELLGLEHS